MGPHFRGCVALYFIALALTPSSGLQLPTEPSLLLPLNTTLSVNHWYPDPYESQQEGSPVMVTYFDYEEGKNGVVSCWETATQDISSDIQRHFAPLRNTPMGSYERDYSGYPSMPRSHLFLQPGEQMTWGHAIALMSSIRTVVSGGPTGNLNGAGFFFEVDVDGLGQVGYGNFTEFSVG